MQTTSPETLVIGSKFYGHDSSVFVVMPNEKRLCAIQTERITRYKHDRIFPISALKRVVAYEHIEKDKVKNVVFCNSFKVLEEMCLPENHYEIEILFRKHFKTPYKKDVQALHAAFDKKTKVQKSINLLSSPSGWGILFQKSLLTIGAKKIRPIGEIEHAFLTKLFPNAQIEIRFYDHEYCHAACTYVTSPYDNALVWAMDGWGDKLFSQVYTAKDGVLKLLTQSPQEYVASDLKLSDAYLPSVGGVYMHFTQQLGFTPEEDEGKVEALAAYGKPVPELLDKLNGLVSIADDLSLVIDSHAFMQSFSKERFVELLQAHSKEDLSATVQAFLEHVTLEYVPKLVEKTGIKNIAMAGGVAANVINNLSIYEHITPNLHLTPAMADDGSAQGAAYAYLLEQKEDLSWIKEMQMPYYSTSYTKEEVQGVLKTKSGIVVEDLGDRWPERTAELLSSGKIGAIFHGKMEWGPRALGHRSIVADVRRKDFRDIINRTIKRRPLFQPFCPSILAEEKDRLFESAYLNKHMTCAFRLKKEFWDMIPSAIHIDGTARAQFVEEKDDSHYYRLIKKVKELTGFGVIINTSFNKHGRTIVESPEDALRDFLDTDMDYLVIEGFLVTRPA